MPKNNWDELKDQKDLDNLMNLFGRFHDSCIKEMYMWTDHHVNEDLSMSISGDRDHRVRLLIQRQYRDPSVIELLFEEVTQIFITPSPENFDSIIYGAKFMHINEIFYWADNGNWDPNGDCKYGSVNWISAKKVKWRDASDWMGETNRYGPNEN